MATSISTSVTKIDKATNLVSDTQSGYIRPIKISVTAKLLKPNTKMYAFFDGVDVNRYFQQKDKELGAQIVTDANGQILGTLHIPPNTFFIGVKEMYLVDTPVFDITKEPTEYTHGACRCTFTSLGAPETYRSNTDTGYSTVVTPDSVTPQLIGWEDPTIYVNPVQPPVIVDKQDPIAQSFFTYGVTGGCFVTSIDLFFHTRDNTIPICLELREMQNGYPSTKLVTDYSFCVLNPADVNIEVVDNLPGPTNFKFNKLVYLQQDKDYCFVVRSPSNNYSLYTAKLNETSFENGKIMFEQPYMGSMFKSENNITWTAEQTEDIKFIINKAKFDTTTTSTVNMVLQPNMVAVDTRNFSTIAGTKKILVDLPFKHGLDVDSYITMSVDTTGTFNGISGASLNGYHKVIKRFSDYAVLIEYISGIAATVSGRILNGGQIKSMVVESSGSGYTTPTLEILGGTGATAVPIVSGGKIVGAKITNPGTIYTGIVTVNITDAGVGTGAIIKAYTDTKFIIQTNRVYHSMRPMINMVTPQDTSVSATLNTITGYYEEDPNSTNYGETRSYNIELSNQNYFDANLLAVSKKNEEYRMNSGNSNTISMELSTSNPNVSPVFDAVDSSIVLRTNSINNQRSEDITSTNSSGFVESIVVDTAGSGYTTPPTIVISEPNMFGGEIATATAAISSNAVSSIVKVLEGSGYYPSYSVPYANPQVYFFGGGGSGAVAHTIVSPYNSELKSGYGSALSRYITKKQSVANPSTGMKIFVTAFSNSNSSFEVYCKTSLSSTSVDHDSLEWKLLTCDVSRNRSKNVSEYLEYEFYSDTLGLFDVYTLKIVLRTKTPWEPPVINNYRTIILT
jgi:hypothetical protein